MRYLVPARARRRSSDPAVALSLEMAKPEHEGKIVEGYPKQELRILRASEEAELEIRA